MANPARRFRFPVTLGLDIDREKVKTDVCEIINMASIVEESGQDPKEFLKLIKQDADEFDVSPNDVYNEEYPEDEKWVYQFDSSEVEKLRVICCSSYDYAQHRSEDFQNATKIEAFNRLGELCMFFNVSVEKNLPPNLHRI